MVNKLNQKEVN